MKMIVPNTTNIAAFEGLIPKRKEIPYCRKENNGYSSMLTSNGDYNYSMLNRTGNLIFELCSGTNSFQDILTILNDKFPDIPESRIFEDLVKVLHQLTQTAAIEWRNNNMMSSNPFSFVASEEISNNCTLSLVMEHEIRETVSFIKSAIAEDQSGEETLHYIWGTNYKEYENAIVVRQCLYSYYKDFFILKSCGRVVGVIIVRPAIEFFLNEATIEMMVLPYNLVEAALKSIISYYSSFPFKQINRLKLQLSNDFYKTNKRFVSILDLLGFSLEAVQKKTYLEKDLYLYTSDLTIGKRKTNV